jgi:alanyl aminopeptidase
VRGLALAALLLACSSDAPPAPIDSVESVPVAVPVPDAATPTSKPPGLRLPGTAAPLSYDLRLEVNPDEPLFRGRVEITTKLANQTDVIWLHAVGLTISSATFRDGAYTGVLTTLPGTEEMVGLRLDRAAGPGEITLVFAYTGKLGSGQQGLFRQRYNDSWFVYTQSESVFARRFVPSFDEPRFKPAWRVTLVVPAAHTALANAPASREQVLPDGRREVTFAEIGPMPSYLLAIAVGPFALVDAGTIGRAKIPVRIAVARDDAKRVGIARKELPAIAAALERYLDRPLPWPKLDFVAVPTFFGAMENIGLVTFARRYLVAPPRGAFVRIAAHELAHQWFGNTVTHAWWDELWLTEAITELVSNHVIRALGVERDERLESYLDGEMVSEDEPPRALRQPIRTTADIEGTFGSTAYERGSWVLETFARYAGETAVRDALRAYVAEHAGGTVTSADLARALAAASSPALGAALASVAERPGVPVVELALRCDGTRPTLEARARNGVSFPICVRYAGAKVRRTCALVGATTEVPLETATCPAWVIGNAGGEGYYRVAWTGAAPAGALATATSLEQLALATDLVVALRSKQPPFALAARMLQAFAARSQAPSQSAARLIARELDALVPDEDRAAWSTWLAKLPRGAKLLRTRPSLQPRIARRAAVGAIVQALP